MSDLTTSLSNHEAELLLVYGEQCLRSAVGGQAPPAPPETAVLGEPLGLFATLRIRGSLRGCIGQFAGKQPLGELFCRVVRDSALSDHRFQPVAPSELEEITLELSLLGRSYAKEDPEQFVLGSEGIILQARGRRSVFLPEVATEQGWDLATTLTHLARKAGLSPDAWQDEEATFQAFRSVKIKRTPAPGGSIEVHLL